MNRVFLKLLFVLVTYDCYAANIDEEVKRYFEHPDRRLLQDTWKKYKRGFETSLEQLLIENYSKKNMNIFKRKMADHYKLTEGFMTGADKVVDVVFKNLYLLELPRMYSPKITFPLGSHLLSVDAGLHKVKVFGEYMVYRNHSVITDANDKNMTNVSPFSLQQVQTSGEVTIIGQECRLTGHAVATLSDQSVNLGHNTFALTDCKFSLEIWNPAQDSPPVFERYFHDCDRNFLQNLISKPLQEELMTKLQGGIYSYVNTSDVFGEDLPKHRSRQIMCFKKVQSFMTSVTTALNIQTAAKTEGVKYIDAKAIQWTEANGYDFFEVNKERQLDSGTIRMKRNSVVIRNVTLYGLDTAYTGHTGGPIEQNGQMYIEDTIGFNTLQITGKIVYKSYTSKEETPFEFNSKFSAEIYDLSVVIRLAVANGLKAFNLDSTDKSKRSWFTPSIRNFELNLFEISEIWARSLVTSYLTTELYTTVMMSLLSGQLNSAIKYDDEVHKLKLYPNSENENVESTEDRDKKPTKDKVLEDDLDSNNGNQNDEESMVLWKGNESDVVLTVGKNKVRVDKGKRNLFKYGKKIHPNSESQKQESTENIVKKPNKYKALEDHLESAEGNQNAEESMVLWKGNESDVVLTVGKNKARVDKGTRNLSKYNRVTGN